MTAIINSISHVQGIDAVKIYMRNRLQNVCFEEVSIKDSFLVISTSIYGVKTCEQHNVTINRHRNVFCYAGMLILMLN